MKTDYGLGKERNCVFKINNKKITHQIDLINVLEKIVLKKLYIFSASISKSFDSISIIIVYFFTNI